MSYDRRSFISYFSSIGLGTTLLPGILWAHASRGVEITVETVACAEELAGLKFDEEQRKQMVDNLRNLGRSITALHNVPLANSVPPSITFSPVLPGMTLDRTRKPMLRSKVAARAVPANLDDLAFLPVTELSELIRTRKVSATALTRVYIDRIKRFDPTLLSVVTLLEDRAMKQAAAADAEIARGKYRGPLHGIPWGAKDLLAVKDYPTTWGTPPYKTQMLPEDATVVRRLDDAGAILIAKLTLGELAQGDIWFGGTTKNPWKKDWGSSGSSAGPAAATAAGLVAFSIGSETLGSISSPSTRCGVTGLRPTFGRVPKTGAMALSWTMDKLGPICRSVEDCALVLNAIYGPDGRDLSVHDAAFNWNAGLRISSLRIGYTKKYFDLPEKDMVNGKLETVHGTKAFDDAALDVLRKLGANLIPVEIPDFPYNAMRMMLTVEAAAAFDELTRSGRDKELVQQGPFAWPNTFRSARFTPAVEYVNASRVRTLAMEAWAKLFQTVDVIVTPTGAAGNSQLIATNLTGHPAVILPNGFRNYDEKDTTQVPVSLTFLGDLFQEAKLLAVASAYQRATPFHLRYPELKLS